MTNTGHEEGAHEAPGRRPEQPPVHGAAAAGRVNRLEHLIVELPVLGQIRLPKPEHLAFYAGIGVLVAVELLEWPAALALGVGHALLEQHHNRAIREFGEALEEV
jgi:hypothetical protein